MSVLLERTAITDLGYVDDRQLVDNIGCVALLLDLRGNRTGAALLVRQFSDVMVESEALELHWKDHVATNRDVQTSENLQGDELLRLYIEGKTPFYDLVHGQMPSLDWRDIRSDVDYAARRDVRQPYPLSYVAFERDLIQSKDHGLKHEHTLGKGLPVTENMSSAQLAVTLQPELVHDYMTSPDLLTLPYERIPRAYAMARLMLLPKTYENVFNKVPIRLNSSGEPLDLISMERLMALRGLGVGLIIEQGVRAEVSIE